MRIWQNNQNRSFVVFLVIFFSMSGPMMTARAQSPSYAAIREKIAITYKSATADQLLKDLDDQTTYDFIFQEEECKKIALSGLQFTSATLGQVLVYLNKKAGLVFAVNNKTISVRKGNIPVAPAPGKVSGKVTGKLVDEESGEPVSNATIQIGGETVISDFNGAFIVRLPAGNYTAVVSSVGYVKKQVTDIEAHEGITEINITLKQEKGQLSEVTVTASARKESVAALYARQKNAAGITDGISAEQISRTPDNNLGESLKRINGLSTMEKKYVVVRGLGERYNGAVLNGQLMPSTELNRKNFNFDILPSNIVENVVVIKTLTPDQNAEFGGGLIEVNTISIPSRNFLSITAGTSINNKTINKPFLAQRLSGSEYWGKVSKDRYLFGRSDWETPNQAMAYYAANGNKAGMFNNNWGIVSLNPPPSQNYQLSGGKVIQTGKKGQLGIIAAASYRNIFNRADVNTGRDGWTRASGTTIEENLLNASAKSYEISTMLNGIAGVGYKWGNNQVSVQTMYLRTLNQQMVEVYNGSTASSVWGMYDNTTQTTLWQTQLKGDHAIGKKGVKITWTGSYTDLEKERPDNHQLLAGAITSAAEADQREVNLSAPGSVLFNGGLRWWTRAQENNYNWGTAINIPFTLLNSKQLFKAGYTGWNKDRTFFVLNAQNFSNPNGFNIPITEIFGPEHLKEITFSRFGDSMHKKASLHALYGMFDNRIGNKWRLVWGVRAEYFNIGRQNGILDRLEKETGYDYSALRNREKNWQFFPSANLTYSLTKRMNIRLAYAKSIIRPDLRELSYFQEYDYELGGEYSADYVRSTVINHYDIRYEWYPSAGDVISITGFYKKLNYPMEIYKDNTNNVFRLENAKDAENYGIEAEVRKSFAFTGVPVLRNITLFGNISYMDARVRRLTITYDNTTARKPIPVENVGTWEKRPQAGASNYLCNAGLYYDTKYISFSLSYNAVTNRLVRVTRNSIANDYFYEQPAKNLDAQLAGRLFRQKLEVKLNISNLLNSFYVVYRNSEQTDSKGRLTKKQLQYQNNQDIVNYKVAMGQTYGITFTYKIK